MAWYVIVAPLGLLALLWAAVVWVWRRTRRLPPAHHARIYPFADPDQPERHGKDFITQEELEDFLQKFGHQIETEVKKMFPGEEEK